MRLGALDLGSNSFHLLVARAGPRGTLEKVVGRKATLRLADAVAASGRIPPVLGQAPGSAISTRSLARWAAQFARTEPSGLMGLGIEATRARGFGLGVVVLAALTEELGAPATRITAGGLREGLLLRELGAQARLHATSRATASAASSQSNGSI